MVGTDTSKRWAFTPITNASIDGRAATPIVKLDKSGGFGGGMESAKGIKVGRDCMTVLTKVQCYDKISGR